jgi:hypothetical protein
MGGIGSTLTFIRMDRSLLTVQPGRHRAGIRPAAGETCDYRNFVKTSYLIQTGSYGPGSAAREDERQIVG